MSESLTASDPLAAPASPEAPPPAAPERKRPLGWRLLKWVGGTLLGLLVAVLALVYYLLGTSAGLSSALALADKLAPGVLSVARVEGRVLGPLHLEGFKLRLPTTEVDLGTFDLDWYPAALFSGVVSVQRLAVRDIDVRLGPPSEEEKEPFSLPNIIVPLRFDLADTSLERLRIFQGQAPEPVFVLDRASLAASLEGSELRLASLDLLLEQPQLSAEASGQANLIDDYPLTLALDWRLDLPPDAKLRGTGTIGGSLKALDVAHQVRGAADVDLKARVTDVLKQPAWDGSLKVLKVDLPAFKPDLPAVETRAELQTRGDLSAAALTGSLDAKAPDLPDFGHLAVGLDVLWKDKRLTIHQMDMTEQVSEAKLDLKGELDLNPTPGRFSLKGEWQRLRWPLSGELLAQSAQGRIDASGSFEEFGYALDAEAQGPSFPAAKLAVKGQGSAERTRLESLRVETLGGLLEGDGEFAWAPALSWALKLRGQDLNPGAFVTGLDDRIGLTLATKGGLERFDYDLTASNRGPGLPPAKLALVGAGDLKRTQVETLRLDLLDGQIEGQAAVDLAPQIRWDAALTLAGINPGSYAPEWPGRIDGKLTSQGALEQAGPALSAVIEQLKGTLRGYPIAASGKVSMAGKLTRIEGVTAESGPSKLRVEGQVSDSLDLSFALASTDLASLVPEAKGRLDLDGKVQGSLQAPQLKVDLRGQALGFGANGLAELSGRADLGLAPDGRFQVQLDGKGLSAGDLRWDQLSVQGDGSLPSHQVNLSLTGEPLSGKLALSGGLGQGGAYKGQLTRLELGAPQAGEWSLQRAAPVALEQGRITAGPLCLKERMGSGGCLDFNQAKAGEWSAGVDLDKLDFALLATLLPKTMKADGSARLKGRFAARGPVLTGSATAEIPRGVIDLELGKGKRQTLNFSDARLVLDAGAGGLSARLSLPLKDLADVRGDLSLPGWRLDAPARPAQPLRGSLIAGVPKLAVLGNLVPDLTSFGGAVKADLNLGGTLGRPGVMGTAEIQNVGFEIPLIALRVKDLNVTAKAPTLERMTIQGGAQVGNGRLEISGDGGLGAQGFAAKVQVSGDKLKVADSKAYYLIVSPAVSIAASPQGAAIRGEIRIPEARIRPRSLPAGTVSPSPDVTLELKESKPAYPVSIDLRLVMGKDVTIDAFGVRGRLDGALAILQAPGKDMLGDGQLQITDGEYRLSSGLGIAAELGAPLTITQGRLIYAKSPIGNPGLLLQAEREAGGTTAGVRVLGTLRAPKLAFFSESDPGMTQAEITKYLMTGIPPSANDQTKDAGLAVGTYIRPKIYMEYESGLGDEANKIKLRYDLSRRIELQTETGENQGADIYFKFEN